MRIRTVKPEFWRNDRMAAAPEHTRLLALALLNYADDEGYFDARPELVRGSLFPFEPDVKAVQRSLQELANMKYVQLFDGLDGRDYGRVIKFTDHQRISHPTKSKIKPLCKDAKADLFALDLVEQFTPLHAASTVPPVGTGNREGEQGIGAGAPSAPAARAKAKGSPLKHTLAAERQPASVRNPLIDALAQFEGIPLSEIGKAAGARLGSALAIIKQSTPDVNVIELDKRGLHYAMHFDGAAKTAFALAKHWGKCSTAPAERPAGKGAGFA